MLTNEQWQLILDKGWTENDLQEATRLWTAISEHEDDLEKLRGYDKVREVCTDLAGMSRDESHGLSQN